MKSCHNLKKGEFSFFSSVYGACMLEERFHDHPVFEVSIVELGRVIQAYSMRLR